MPKPARDRGCFSLLLAFTGGELNMPSFAGRTRRVGRGGLCAAFTSLMLIMATQAHGDDHAAEISSLSWMTGSWAGPAGDGATLEENWAEATGGSIASLVRITTAESTPMVELIVIEERDSTLVLNLQQWDPGFTPRTPGPQTMIRTAQGDRSIEFTATGAGSLKTLAYSSPDAESFNIDIVTADGNPIALQLKAMR